MRRVHATKKCQQAKVPRRLRRTASWPKLRQAKHKPTARASTGVLSAMVTAPCQRREQHLTGAVAFARFLGEQQLSDLGKFTFWTLAAAQLHVCDVPHAHDSSPSRVWECSTGVPAATRRRHVRSCCHCFGHPPFSLRTPSAFQARSTLPDTP